MRRFLYITPYFPPQSRVGALRPLKFARHLPKHGWAPVVLCDLWPSAGINPALTATIPQSTTVIRDYSRRARPAEAALSSQHDKPPKARKPPKRSGGFQKWIPDALNNPELVPLGEHSVHMRHALGAARKALAAHPECEAIMVNADPYAALMVGARLARQTGLPLIQDLRDPWSVCELRRMRRPAPIRRLVDKMERWAFEPASRVILNTETTLRDYRAHYPDFAPRKLTCIRNHGDADLIGDGEHAGFDRFTLLFLGHFRRFLEGGVLLRVLSLLLEMGVPKDGLQLVVTGNCPAETWARAKEMGVDGMLKLAPFVPYTEIGAIMAEADVLVALSNRSTQRIPAKFYDYAITDKPMLMLADNAELAKMVKAAGGGMFGLDDAQETAAWIHAVWQKGRGQHTPREPMGLSTSEATAKLAAILDDVSAEGPSQPDS